MRVQVINKGCWVEVKYDEMYLRKTEQLLEFPSEKVNNKWKDFGYLPVLKRNSEFF